MQGERKGEGAMNFIVGLTGGIGSGKSTVADLFAELGAHVVDTDRIAHELTGAQGAAMAQIVATFGDGVVLADGSLDRVAMRRLCFSSQAAKARLETILHPMIRRESEARCAADVEAPYILLVVPLFVEAGVNRQRVDRILVVDCDESVQEARVMVRNGMSVEDVRAIMAAQASREARLAVADDVLLNNDGRELLRGHVAALHLNYLERAGARAKTVKFDPKC